MDRYLITRLVDTGPMQTFCISLGDAIQSLYISFPTACSSLPRTASDALTVSCPANKSEQSKQRIEECTSGASLLGLLLFWRLR